MLSCGYLRKVRSGVEEIRMKAMTEKTLNYFDISQICNSGQCFRMSQKGEDTYSVIAGERYLEIQQSGNQCTFYCDEAEYENYWKHYFDLDTDYEDYKNVSASVTDICCLPQNLAAASASCIRTCGR